MKRQITVKEVAKLMDAFNMVDKIDFPVPDSENASIIASYSILMLSNEKEAIEKIYEACFGEHEEYDNILLSKLGEGLTDFFLHLEKTTFLLIMKLINEKYIRYITEMTEMLTAMKEAIQGKEETTTGKSTEVLKNKE